MNRLQLYPAMWVSFANIKYRKLEAKEFTLCNNIYNVQKQFKLIWGRSLECGCLVTKGASGVLMEFCFFSWVWVTQLC